MNTDLVLYYKERAKEYEKIYQKPERREDLQTLAVYLQQVFTGVDVFEICCGTGYWTAVIAKTARSIFATDINDTVLEIARHKTYDNATVTFGNADIFSYSVSKPYQSLFAGFIWSHIQLQDIPAFLDKLNSFVIPGGTIVLVDNNYVEGSNHPVIKTDEQGNSFQSRKLADGSMHLVRKNFPSESFIREQLKNKGSAISFINLQYYWLLIYKKQDKDSM